MALNPLDPVLRDIADIKRQLAGRSQLNHSSLEDTAIPVYDGDGTERLRIGAQDDGTHSVKYVQGPPPPRPTAPVVSVDGPVVRVRWDGMLLGGHIPEDFARIDVHFALASEDLEADEAVRGNLATSAGNETVLAATSTGTYRVGLVAMSQSRTRSEMSEVVDVEVTLVDIEGALDAVVENARGGSNHYSPEPPSGTDHDPDRDLWFDTSTDEDGLVSYTPHRWDEDAQQWVPVGDEHISVLRQKLADTAAELEAMPRPNYGTTEPTHDAPDGSAYFQIDDSAVATYEWAGDPHASASIKYVDGQEVARNHAPNPSFEISADTNMYHPSTVFTSGRSGIGATQDDWAAYFNTHTSTTSTVYIQQTVPVERGGWTAFRVDNVYSLLASGSREGVFALRLGALVGGSWTYSDRDYLPATPFGGPALMSAQLPDGATELRAMIYFSGESASDRPLAGDRWWTDGWQISIADTEADARAQVEEYFDGDTPDGTVGGFDKIVAQWERRDGEWIQVPIRSEAIASLEVGKLIAGIGVMDQAVVRKLFAEVVVAEMSYADAFIGTNAFLEGAITAESGIIGSLDLGVATVGYLNGARIEAGTIDTPQLAFGAATGDVLSVDALNFKTAVGLDIRGSSFRAGDAVEITEDFGVRQFGPDGALNVSIPSDGSEVELRGGVSASTFTATGNMSIQGHGALASGGVLELESGVVPPVAGPQVTNTWDRTTFPPLTDQEAPAGLAWADGHFWRCVTTSVGLSEGGRTRIEKISPTGELVGGWDTTFRVSVDGITILNDEIYVLAWGLSLDVPGAGPIHPRVVVVYNLQGVEQRRWADTLYTPGTYQQGIGSDGTNIILAKPWNDGILRWRTWTPTGTYLETINSGRVMRSNVTQVLYGEFDYADGPKRIVAQQRTDLKAFVCYDAAATAPDDVGRSWNAADFQNPVGLVWDGARFHSLTPDGNLASYQSRTSEHFVGDDEDDWWAAAGWQHEGQQTPAGPATRFTYYHRANVRIQTGDAPVGAGGYTVYLAKGDQYPTRTDLHWVWKVSDSTAWSFVIENIVNFWETTESPPLENTFTTDAPGEIHSAIGTFRVDGTGSGEWGPLAFHADGTATGKGTIVTGRVDHPQVPAGGESHQLVVTFPAGRFTRPPTVLLTNTNGLLAPVVAIDSTTATSATIRVWNWTDATAAVSRTMWAAIDEGA